MLGIPREPKTADFLRDADAERMDEGHSDDFETMVRAAYAAALRVGQ